MARATAIRIGTALIACLSAVACGGGGGGGGSPASPPPPSPPPPPPPPAAGFVDATQASNIDYVVGITRPSPIAFPEILVAESTFGGAAAGDCDGDTDIDLFITYGDDPNQIAGGGPNRLYLNQLIEGGNGLQFQDVAAAAGVANTRSDGAGNDRHSGPAFADMDGDGDLDLFVGGIFGDPNKIYENVDTDGDDLGDCVFEDVTATSGIDAMLAPHTVSAAFGDYDLDGDLDMFLSHWGTRDALYGNPRDTETDHLWENVSDAAGIRFVNVSEASGVSGLLWTTRPFGAGGAQAEDFTFTPTFADINNDRWPDILIASDFGTSQALLNNGDGATFRLLGDTDLRDAQNGMGSALGDIDNDGDLDWFVTSIFNPNAPGGAEVWGNRLFRNDLPEGGTFTDITDSRGVAEGDWGWGACFLDIDNDTDLDIFHTNGWDLEDDRAQGRDFSADLSRMFVMGENGRFASAAGVLGLADSRDTRAVVCADFDHDGDIDLLVHSGATPNSALLSENWTASAGNNALRIQLEGLTPNTAAVGARIFVTTDDVTQMREVLAGGNFTAQNPAVQVFGLGSAARIDELRVEWPAVVAGAAMLPDQPVTVIDDFSDARLQPTAPGETLVLRHPGL